MSARDLEEFIRVIESAEKLSPQYKNYRCPSTSTCSVTSYPTDIFRNRSRVSVASAEVNRLWDPKSASEFLGSSYGSAAGSSNGGGAPSQTPQRQSRVSVGSSSNTTCTAATSAVPDVGGAVQQSSRRSSASTTSTDGGKANLVDNPLVAMQRFSTFGRVQAKELSPAVTPESSPVSARRLKRSASNKPALEDNGESLGDASGASASTKSSPVRYLMKKGGSKSSSGDSSQDSSGMNSTKSVDLTTAVEAVNELTESPELPRSPPVPRPRVTIRQASVKVHDHQQTAEALPEISSPKQASRARPPKTSESTKTLIRARPRPKSAPGTRTTTKVKPKPEPAIDLRSYSKSLKLLGLDVPSNRKEATKLTHQTINIRTTTPTLRTRLRERTQSVTNLQEIIDSKLSLPKDKYNEIRDPLAKAVFEEWYFRKVTSEAEWRRKEAEKKEEEEYEKELKQADKKESSVHAYEKWLKMKKMQVAKKARLGGKGAKELDEEKKERQTKIKKAQLEWREKKQKEFAKACLTKQLKVKELEEELKAKREKRAEAEKHFNSWRDKINETTRAKVQRERQLKLQELEDKREKAKEKKEEAEFAFNGWLRKKAEERSQNVAAVVVELHPSVDTRTEKAKAARQAYEDWLEYVEQREIEEMCIEEARALRQMWRPPWYPPGVAEV